MTPEESLAKLEETRNEVIRFTNELDERLRANEVDGIQYYVMLHERLGGKSKEEILRYIGGQMELQKQEMRKGEEGRKKRMSLTFAAAAIVAVLMISAALFYNNPSITGFITSERETQETVEYSQVFDTYTETQMELDKITGLKISGMLEGTGGAVKLRINGIEYLVAELSKPEDSSLITGMAVGEEEPAYVLYTDKESYYLGETATLTLEPDTENKSLYVKFGEEMQKLEQDTFVPSVIGDHQAIAIITLEQDIIRVEHNFTVIEQMAAEEAVPEMAEPDINETNETEALPEPTEQAPYYFEAVCAESCNLPENTNPTLIVELEPGSKLTISSIIVTRNKENEAPIQERKLPDITLEPGQASEISLDDYFTDPDGDTIQYDMNEIPEISWNITQNILSLSGTAQGIYTAYIYATDGDKLTISNTFEISITEPGQEEAGQPVITEGNETSNQTSPTIPVPETADPCKNPDPNLRPLTCMEGFESEYFVMESVILQDNKRSRAARITPLGNLLISGDLIETSSSEPRTDDFKVTYMNDYYENIPVAWIDSTTGDLHLRGELYEEDFFLTPTPNAFVIQNKRNINLAYIDRRTGDLHIKGNLIQNKVNLD